MESAAQRASDANLANVAHLRPVPDPKPPSRPTEREDVPSIAELERWATVLRIECTRMLAVAKSGHLDSSLSAADIVAALYYRVLRHDPENPDWPERDRFVLCKGHAAPIQYAALAHHGYFQLRDLMGLRQIGSQLQGHPDMNRTAGVEVSTGSLGQGLSMCLGITLALRLDGLADTAQVFGLLSDGDCQEGQTWEAAMAAPHYGVPNLTAIVDYNHLQTDGTTEEVMDTGDVRAKFEAFGWDAIEIDGHDMNAIVEALERSRTIDRPAAIVCQTKKGRGVSTMEGRFGFHGKPPSPEQAEEALTELEAKLEEQTAALQAAEDGEGDR
jgi:transketolase